jgi:uncharacterized protein (DUF1697 family)
MSTFVALLRAVNVAGHGMVAMADLRRFLADLGFDHPQTLLQSGNLVFDATGRAAAVERRLQLEAAARLDVRTEFFVRTAAEWHQIVAGNPFRREAQGDPRRLVLMVLKTAPSESAVQALQQAIVGRERVAADGRHLYATYPDGYGRSRLTTVFVEKALETSGTARNWNTVTKIDALVAGRGVPGPDLL